MRPEPSEAKEMARVGSNSPEFVAYIKRSYAETQEQLVRCEDSAFPRLQGKARTLKLLIDGLEGKALLESVRKGGTTRSRT